MSTLAVSICSASLVEWLTDTRVIAGATVATGPRPDNWANPRIRLREIPDVIGPDLAALPRALSFLAERGICLVPRMNSSRDRAEDLRLDEALADRVTDEARGFVDLELRHDPRPVR